MEIFSNMIVVSIIAVVAFIIGLAFAASKLYIKTPSSRSFVRTGSGKAKVVLDGGAWVIPLLHEMRWVSLETMRIEVKRHAEAALITADKLRADVAAEFYIRVEPTEQQILAASRSLGSRSVTESDIDNLIAPKLISALRSVGAQKTLMELHEKRDGFAEAVHQIVKSELEENGLLLETVTISNLDASSFRSDANYFDAQGVSHITETLQKASSRKNEIEQSTKEAIARKNVDTRKAILLLEQEQKQAELQQELEVNRLQIEQRRQIESETSEKQASQEKVKIEQARSVQETKIQTEIELIEKNKDKDTAAELAKVSVEKARLKAQIEIVEQNKEKDVASASAQIQILTKEKERLEFEAQKEQANQQLLTVEAVQQARRAAEIQTIDAEVLARKEKIAQETSIDISVMQVKKEAQAKFEAADLEAKRIERLAQAALVKAQAEAEGERLLLEARNQIGQNLLLQELIRELPDIARELVAPVAKINDIKLFHMGGMPGSGNEGSHLGDTLLKSTMLYPILREVMQSQGLDLNQLLQRFIPAVEKPAPADKTVTPTVVKPQQPTPKKPAAPPPTQV